MPTLTELFASKKDLIVTSLQLDLIIAGLFDPLTLIDLPVPLEREFAVQIDLHSLEIDNFRSIASICCTHCR